MTGSSGGNGLAAGWHVSVGGTSQGPYSWGEIVRWTQEGRIRPETLVWQAQLHDWTPARQVPGLFPGLVAAPPAPPVPPAPTISLAPRIPPAPRPPRARPSKLLIALVCLAIAVVAAGAAVGTYFAARGPGQPDAGQAVAAEKLHLQGRVVLPEGAALAPKDLVMLSNSAEGACSASGAFDMAALHDSGARTVLLALNSKRNPVLMAIADTSSADLQPSVASTARTLVLYDPAFLSLPKSAYAAAAKRLESDPRLSQLESALTGVLRSDPDAPLDADAHPDIYELAAQIAANLLSGVIQIDESATDQPAVQASFATTAGGLRTSQVRLASRPAALLALGGSTGAPTASTPGAAAAENFVDVVDDPEHSTSEVALVNTTFATYLVDWTLTTPKGTTSDWTLLPRCKLWQVDATSLQVGFPPAGFKMEKLVKAGNGQLTFTFKRNDDYMAVDLALNAVTLVVGVGSEAIRKLEGGGRDLAASSNAAGGVLLLSKELGALGSRMQGQSYAGCAKEMATYFAVNWGRVAIAVWPLIQSELKEEFLVICGKVITRRMLAMAVIGYGSFELVMQFRAFGNPAIATWSTQGTQVGNVYPFGATLKLTATPRDVQTFVFGVTIRGLPVDFRTPLEVEMDFGDGNTTTIQPNIEAGGVPLDFTHAYAGTPPKTVRAVLRTYSSTPMILASQEIDLPTDMASTTTTDPTSINGNWRGQAKSEGKVIAELQVSFQISKDGTGTISLLYDGMSTTPGDVTYRDGVVKTGYFTGHFAGGKTLILSRSDPGSPTITWELTRVQ